MTPKTRVIIEFSDSRHGEYSKGDTGFIEGFVPDDYSGSACAIVRLENNNKFVAVPLFELKCNPYRG